MAKALQEVAISQPRMPVVSNYPAKGVRSASEIRGLLVRQLTSPVLWSLSMQRLVRFADESSVS